MPRRDHLVPGIRNLLHLNEPEYPITRLSTSSIQSMYHLRKKKSEEILLIDETNNVSTINDQLRKDLVHVFNNENEFPFLKKVYDSNENGFNYHVKLFKIDYTK